MEIELSTLVSHVEDYLDASQEARTSSETCRDYRDHKQWSDAEKTKLEERGQAAIVNNKIEKKVKFMVGEQQRRRRDPKAYPRTPEHEGAADAATDALRYIADNTMFTNVSSEVFENEAVEGTGAVIIEVNEKRDDFEIEINYISWDRYYYDPHSRRKDFSDKTYDGIVIWMDKADAKEKFPEKADIIDGLFNTAASGSDNDTHEDKPSWIDRKRERIKVCQHYFLHKSEWHVAYFSEQTYLIEPMPSTYLNEFGEPENPIASRSAYVDRENNRFGEVIGLLGLQDEINHRHSKYLHLLSTRQTYGNEHSIEDAQAFKNELAKPNGHISTKDGEFGRDFGVLPTGDMAIGQFNLLQEAKNEIDTSTVNASLEGTQSGDSGRALQIKQAGGLTELGPIYEGHRQWENEVYRQVWNRVKQFWTREKWIRVTDDEDNLKFVGLNQPVTNAQALQELIEDRKTQPEIVGRAQAMIQSGDPRLQEVKEIRNQVAEIDVDIIIEEGPDTKVIQQEQFDTLSSLAQAYGPEAVPFKVMLNLSDLPHKDRIKDMLDGKGEEDDPVAMVTAQAQEAMQQMEAQYQQVVQDLEAQVAQLSNTQQLEVKKVQLTEAELALEAETKQAQIAQTDRELDLKEQELAKEAATNQAQVDKDVRVQELKSQEAVTVAQINASKPEPAPPPPAPEPQEPQPIIVNVGSSQKRIELQRDASGMATGATVSDG